MTEDQILQTLSNIYGESDWPQAVRFLHGLYLVRNGLTLTEAARRIRTNATKLRSVVGTHDPVAAALNGTSIPTDQGRSKARRALGQMIVGRAAETVFLDLFRETFKGEELDIENVSEEGSDTDIYLVNGKRRRLYRINIKFFGSVFRKAEETVGLAPDDCFALATYKIKSGIAKQISEGKPYFFAIVGVPGLTADVAGGQFPEEILDVAAIVLSSRAPQRRKFEDSIIDCAAARRLAGFRDCYDRIHKAPWYVLSAERANRLLREMLFDRVPALSVRNFTRMFQGAEVDMHFSLSRDLTPLPMFFDQLATEGREHVTTLLSKGIL